MASGNLIALVAGVIGIGVVAQVLADRFRVPSVIFLLAAGVALGPDGLALIGPDSFGDALSAIVGLSVAIIIFEGAFHLRIDRLREAPAATLRLVTIGAAVALVATAVAVRLFMGVDWLVAFLIGALLVATGPTVIAPILEEVAAGYDGKIKIAKLNIDENPETPPKYGIRGIPTLMLFKNGNVEATKVGALSKAQLSAFIDSNL